MKTINPEEINVCLVKSAALRNEPFDHKGLALVIEINEALKQASEVAVLTAEDADFAEWAEKLGYGAEMPSEIYVVDNNLAFTL